MRSWLAGLLMLLAVPLGVRAETGPAPEPAVVIAAEGDMIRVVEILGLSERQLTGVAIGAAAGAILGTLLSSGSAPLIAAVVGGAIGYWFSTHGDPLRRRSIGIEIACNAPACAALR